MADNINFIPASELPATEAESVEVLCLENGELKKKAAEGLGGGAGGYILKLSEVEVSFDNDSGAVVVTSDCADMVKALEGGAAVIICTPANFYGEGIPNVARTDIVGSWWVYEGGLYAEAWDGTFTFPNTAIPSFFGDAL